MGGVTPPSLRTPPLYFAGQNTGEEFKSSPLFIADRQWSVTTSIFCWVKHPAMLRGTARERLMPGLLLSLFFQPLRPSDTSPIFCVAKHPVILRDTAGRREGNTFLVFVFLPYTTNRRSLYRFATPNAMGHGREGGLNTIPIMPHHSLAVLRRVLAMPRGTRQGRGVKMFLLSRERWKVGNFMSCAV